MAAHSHRYHHRGFPRFGRVYWNPRLMSVWKWSHYAIVEDVEPFKLHPTSMLYIYKVFEHLKQLWMGIWRHIHSVTSEVFEHLKQLWMSIWQHIHSITTTDVSPDLGELAEILDDVNVKTIPIRYHWGCGTFQTASHIHGIHVLGVWTP